MLESEPAAVQAAALRYAPAHVRSAFLAERSPAERSALAAALAAPKSLSKEHLLDVASTLRARAADQAHLDAGETGDIDLAVELIEERPPAEQADMLEAMRRADPAKARAVQARARSAISRSNGCPTRSSPRRRWRYRPTCWRASCATFPRASRAARCRRCRATVAASIQEDLSLEVAPTPQQIVDARRMMFASLRKALRDRGLAAPSLAIAGGSNKGKVVAL